MICAFDADDSLVLGFTSLRGTEKKRKQNFWRLFTEGETSRGICLQKEHKWSVSECGRVFLQSSDGPAMFVLCRMHSNSSDVSVKAFTSNEKF